MSDIRVRFAPSPTGLLHIGGARTALFNWLFARHTGGTFILRIEDTDAARNTPEAVDIIFRGLSWLGLDWDEGPQPDGSTRGDYGPYFQSQRNAVYQVYIEKLLSSGQAYEFEGAVKFKVPHTPIVVRDLIRGDVTFDRTTDPDLVIRRKDGSPVFHLVNVVDDLEMKISHVIRGEDHLSNTPKHLALFEAFGAPIPQYAHIPLILNTNGSKMSKRDEGASIGEYLVKGYLPAAARNYLCLLGWSPRDNSEILPIEQVIEKFELSEINHSNARFDLNKLYWVNGEYMRQMSVAELQPLAVSWLQQSGVIGAEFDQDYLREVLPIVKEKVKLGRELTEWMRHFFTEEFPYDEAATKKIFTPDGLAALAAVRDALSGLSEFSPASLEKALQELALKEGRKMSVYVHPTRLAVSGSSVGPSLYHMLSVLGPARVQARLDRALRQFATSSAVA